LTSQKRTSFLSSYEFTQTASQHRTNILLVLNIMTKNIFLCRDANQHDSPSSHRSASQPLCLLSI